MINCIVVDDEPYAIELLSKHIAAYEHINLVSKCRNIREAVSVLQSKQIDLMFLDVRMPDVTGMEFLESVSNRPKVILTTAYREYAIEAYEYGVIDYLLKPISFIRFAKAINRFQENITNAKTTNNLLAPVVLRSGSDYHKLIPEHIEYIKSAKEYVSIVCKETKLLVRSSMSSILQQLPEAAFIQTHKSYIVPINKIQSISSSEVLLVNGERIPIGRSYLDDVRKVFSN
ncbi:MAG: response regulator [Flavipsychrobacter sp.]